MAGKKANRDGDIWDRQEKREQENERLNRRLSDGFDLIQESGDGEEDDDED